MELVRSSVPGAGSLTGYVRGVTLAVAERRIGQRLESDPSAVRCYTASRTGPCVRSCFFCLWRGSGGGKIDMV
jgi:hypothetical protein